MDRPCSVRAIVEVDAASQPISGSFMLADGTDRRPFNGWIELTGAIESMRTATERGHGARTPHDLSLPDLGAPR